MKKLVLLSFVLMVAQQALAQARVADAIIGTWFTRDNKARVEIVKTGKTYSGRIIWLKEPLKNGQPKTDSNNPDPNLRKRGIVGLDILRGFVFDGDDTWDDGIIYDPESGKEYSCKITMPDKNTLKVRGYVGISLLGRTEVWKKG